jgi:SPP1 gp7 family putative phage head morphogenesis protein
MREFNNRLAALETESLLEMAQRWKKIEDRLWKYFDLLIEETNDRGLKTPSELYSMYRYQELVRIAQDEISQYESWAGNQISREQMRAVELGYESAARSVYKKLGKGILAPIVNHSAVKNMVGLAGDGSPLFSLLRNRSLITASVDGLSQALVEGVALGYSPRKTARMMASGLSEGLNKALVIARTEQLRAYRTANIEQYENMGIQQWQRHCSFSDRTCLACLGLDGKIYSTRDGFASHPGCRCFTTAVIPGEPLPESSAKKWFSGLDDERKKAILGKGHYELYKNGTPLDAMVSVKDDPVWGPSIRIRGVADIKSGGNGMKEGIEEVVTNEIDFSTSFVQIITDSRDYSSIYPEDPLQRELTARQIVIDGSGKRHIQQDHQNDYEWISKNHDSILRAISSPEIIDIAPRLQRSGKINVAQSIRIDEESHLIIVLQFDKPSSHGPAQIYTAFRAPERYLFSKGVLKNKWKVVKK